MIEKYVELQEEITKLLLNAIEKNKLVQAYMFCSENINFLLDYAKDFSKNLICEKMPVEKQTKISNKIDKNEYEELIIIEPINGIIKRNQIDELKLSLATKPIIGKRKVYIIKNCESLNIISANSMLKFIEEADENIVAIFLTDNIDSVIPTIKSRCQILNFKNINVDGKYKFLDSHLQNKENIEELYLKSMDFIEHLSKNKINTYYKLKELLYDNFVDREDIQVLVNIILYFYYDVFNYKIFGRSKYIKDDYINMIEKESQKDINEIINYIFKIEKIKTNLFYNLNQKLLFDRIVLEFSEV